MITARERNQILLAEWLQKKAEEEHQAKMSRKATHRTQRLRMEIYADECNRSTDDD